MKHETKSLPGIVRIEIYESENLKYEETFDDLTGKRMYGKVFKDDDIFICYVGEQGNIEFSSLIPLPTNHKQLLDFIADLEKIDKFIADVCEEYMKNQLS